MQLILIVPALIMMAPSPTPKAQDTPPFAVASEYIRELGEMWAAQQKVDLEQVEDRASSDPANRGEMTLIRHAARVNMILRTNISMLKTMRLTRKPFDTTLGMFIALYGHKAILMEEMSKNVGAFLGGPKVGVDYGKILVRAPQITAEMEDVDKSLFQGTLLMFGALIDMKADSLNRANHLLITKAERDELVKQIAGAFGQNLETDKRYVVASAWLMKTKLLEFKCSDEPWE